MPHIHRLARTARFTAIAALAGLLGCATTPPPKPAQPSNITLNGLGIVRFMGEPIAVDQLPRRLRKAGYTPQQEIRVHLTDATQNTQALGQIISVLHKNGFTRVLFMEAPRAVSHAAGEPEIVAPPTVPAP